MAEFTVRPAAAVEAQALTALCMRSKAHWGYDAEFMRLSSRALTVTADLIAAGRVLVADNGNGIALGVAAVVPMDEPGSYDLHPLFVDPAPLGPAVAKPLLPAV